MKKLQVKTMSDLDKCTLPTSKMRFRIYVYTHIYVYYTHIYLTSDLRKPVHTHSDTNSQADL